MVNISFDSNTINTLKGIIGESFEYYTCDQFIFTHCVFAIVGITINDSCFKLTSDFEQVQRFYNTEDVSVLKFQSCNAKDIVSRMDNGILQDNPVKDTITKIDIVNDHETVTHEGITSDLISTKGMIFYLSSGNEIAFEVTSWFSEMITVHRGYNLLEHFSKTDDFIEEWEDCDGYYAHCSRDVISIS